ncbi:MAG: Hsp70 family protein [Pseudonocardiaceae bacterium]
MSYSLGIDIGTTFVAVAVAQASTTAMVPLGPRSVVAPAAVWVRGDGTLAAGDAADLPAVSDPERICRHFMSRLGDPAPVVLGGRPYELTTVLGVLLHDVVQWVSETQGEPPDHIALTHPASWGPFRCALYGEAARQAGLGRPAMVTEPEAAVAHYTASQALDDGDTVAVYDLGGGTFNATVLRRQSGGMQILGKPERLERVGSGEFDRFDVSLARSDVETKARGPIESTLEALSRTLSSAQVQPAELSAVLLVGGSSQIPLVARMVSAELGRPVTVDSQPQYVVALGAAALAAEAAPRYRPVSYDRPGCPAPSAPRQRSASPVIPTQRTATSRPAAPGDTVLTNTAAVPKLLTVAATAPVAKPRPAPSLPPSPTTPSLPPSPTTPSPPPVEDPPPGPRHGGRSESTDPPPRRGSRGPQVLLGTGAVVALTAMIVLAILGGRSVTQTPAAAAPPPKPEPIVAAEVGPQVAIPTVSATVRVERSPSFVAVSPDGKHAYTAHRDPQVVTVLDTATNQVIETISIAAGPPQFLTFAPDGRTLYVTLFNEARTIHSIAVLDTTSNTVVTTIPQPARPYLPAVTPDGTRLFVPNHDIGAISVINTATNKVIKQITVPPNPHWVAFSQDGTRAYAANHESNLVSVIDTTTLAVLKTIPVGASPHSIAVNPQRPLAANVNFDSDSVSAIDTTTEQVVATIPVGDRPRAITWAPDGRFAYVVNEGSNTVSVIDATTNQVSATLPTETGPTSITVLPDGRRAYVSNLDSGTLTVLDLPS